MNGHIEYAAVKRLYVNVLLLFYFVLYRFWHEKDTD
jgi:hypothetical protein